MHLADLKTRVRRFDAEQGIYLGGAQYDATEKCHVLYTTLRADLPRELGLILGDFAHNARGALDHAFWDIVTKFGTVELDEQVARTMQFPLVEERTRFDKKRSKFARHVGDAVWDLMREFQPFPELAENAALGTLRLVSNGDKHRLLFESGPRSARLDGWSYEFSGPRVGEIRDARVENHFDRLHDPDAPWADYLDGDVDKRIIARLWLAPSDIAPEIEVAIHPISTVQVLLGSPQVSVTVPELDAIISRVAQALEAFEALPR